MAQASVAQLGPVSGKNVEATQVVLDAVRAAGFSPRQVFGVGGGDHADGYATDFMTYDNVAMGNWIADWVWDHREQLGVRWIIWRQRIRSTSPGKPGTWQPMEDRGSVTQNHMDHVHVKWRQSPVQLAQMIVDVTKDIAAAVGGVYTVRAGDTLGGIAGRFKVTVDQLVSWNGIKDRNVIAAGQKIRVVAPAKPTPAPAKPPAKPAPKPSGRPWLIAGQKGVYRDRLRPGVKDSTSVYLFQLALRKFLGDAKARKLNPSGATGYYGEETKAMCRAAYATMHARQPQGGWNKGDTNYPEGIGLLQVLKLPILGQKA